MKKAIILLCVVAGILSCTKEPKGPQEPAADTPMTFEISVAETKAAKTAWADGDQIYVFFHGLAHKFLILERKSGNWDLLYGKESFVASDFNGLTKKLTAIHFPYKNVLVTDSDDKFTFTKNSKPIYNYYLYETDKDYTVSGTTVTVTLQLGKPANMVQIHVDGIQANEADYTFGCSKIKPVACASVGTDGTINETELQAGARLIGIADSDGVIFAGRLVYPGEAKDYKFTLASNDNICTLTRPGKTLTAGTMYNFPAPTSDGGWTVQSASELYVDLGLSVKWAKYNVGATTETESGDYFAWGEVTGYNEGKTNFDWSTYAWGNASNALTKYCNKSSYGKDGFTDALTTLLPEDDAAYAAMGGKFRMPTSNEIVALIATKNNTAKYTWTWCDGSTEKYNESTTPGWKIVRKSNSATLFLPAASSRIYTNPPSAGTSGLYWSSSLDTSEPDKAYFLTFNHTGIDWAPQVRLAGRPIRPVSE